MGSLGPGTPFDIGLAWLKNATKVDITFVPFNGNGSVDQRAVGRARDLDVQQLLQRLRPAQRRAAAPAGRRQQDADPAAAGRADRDRVGVKDYEVAPWFGVYAPAKTPKEIVTQYADWFSAALKAPEIKEKLAVQELYPMGLCGADFAAFLRKQQEDYGRAIKETNFKME